jgi:hypothetical protein
LPTALEIKQKLAAEKKAKKQNDYEERLYARYLLFGTARGRHTALNRKDHEFVLYVQHKSYDAYIEELNFGTNRWEQGKKWRRILRTTAARPWSFMRWRRRWWATQKYRYRTVDVPKMMKMRWEMLHESNPAVCEQREGQWMSALRRAISEREPGSLGVPVPDVQVRSSSEQGWNKRPQPIRERREAQAGSNRNTEAVGE